MVDDWLKLVAHYTDLHDHEDWSSALNRSNMFSASSAKYVI